MHHAKREDNTKNDHNLTKFSYLAEAFLLITFGVIRVRIICKTKFIKIKNHYTNCLFFLNSRDLQKKKKKPTSAKVNKISAIINKHVSAKKLILK